MEMARVQVESGRRTGTTGQTIAINIGERLIKGGVDVSAGVGGVVSATVITSGETVAGVVRFATRNQIVNPLIGHHIMWTTGHVRSRSTRITGPTLATGLDQEVLMFVPVTRLRLFTPLAHQRRKAKRTTLLDKAHAGRVLAVTGAAIGSLFTIAPGPIARVSGGDELELAISRMPRKAVLNFAMPTFQTSSVRILTAGRVSSVMNSFEPAVYDLAIAGDWRAQLP